MSTSLTLYRQFLREVKQLPVPAIRSKLTYNCRELFELHRAEKEDVRLHRLRGDVDAASRLLIWFRRLPKVSRTRASPRDSETCQKDMVHSQAFSDLQDKFETLFKQFD